MLLNKSTSYTVLMPQKPTARERFAGEELERYLTEILGTEPSSGECAEIKFIIGGPGRNTAARDIITKEDFDATVTGEEGYLIRITESAVLLAGSEDRLDDERGTLYAVYEFLERYCGCTFGAYSHPDLDAGETIPRGIKLSLSEGDTVKASADRLYRTAIVQYGDRAGNPKHKLNRPFFDWLAKNRYNRIFLWASGYISYSEEGLTEELEKRGIRLTVGHHESLWLWLPYYGNPYFPEHYIETHPEYYRLNSDGTRFKPKEPNDPFGQWILCSRSEGAIEAVSRNMIEFIKKNPSVDTVTLFPNDEKAEQCCCERCRRHSKAENHLYFQNEVARRVTSEIPYAKIDMIAYMDIWKAPEGTRLHPSLEICVATWSHTLRSAGKPDGSCIIGTDFDDTAIGWRRTGAEVYYYDYYMGIYHNRQRILPMADELQSLWRHYKEVDIKGAGTQIEPFNLWNFLLNFYSFARTGYDTALSLENNISSIARLFTDKNDSAVAKIMRLFEEVQDGQESVRFAGKYLIENIDLDKVYKLFESARGEAKTPRERNNLRLLRMAFRHSHLETVDKINELPQTPYVAFRKYDDPSGELAYIATNFDSFGRNNPGYAIACPAANSDTKGFSKTGFWYEFE